MISTPRTTTRPKDGASHPPPSQSSMTVIYGGIRVKAKMYSANGRKEMRRREVKDRDVERVEVVFDSGVNTGTLKDLAHLANDR